jgi:hypothetical protein
MRMRQNLAEFESAFFQEIEDDRVRRAHLRRQAVARARRREIERTHKHGSMRFALLVAVLLGTAVVVTIAMFQTLYYVMG